MIVKGKDYLIRKRQTIKDILHNQEIIEFSEKKETQKLEMTT
jgi:diaminopimelate decarboxylase